MRGKVLNTNESSVLIEYDAGNGSLQQWFDFGEKVKPEYAKTGSCEFSADFENFGTNGHCLVTFIKSLDQQSQSSQSSHQTNQDDMTSFEDLLKDAHSKFGDNLAIKTELVKEETGKPLINIENQMAVFKAQVIVGEENNTRVFEAHGDSTKDNIGKRVKEHFIRMAETRAIVRALRLATNNAGVAKEET